MVRQYVEELYCPAAKQYRRLSSGDAATRLAAWKAHIASQWPDVGIERTDRPPDYMTHASYLTIELRARLGALRPDDVRVECVVEQPNQPARSFQAIEVPSADVDGSTHFRIEFEPPFAGLQTYRIRIYPYHELLSHPFEMGRMIWI